MTATETLDRAALAQFTGTENWYRYPLNPKILYTDGAKYVADKGGAYWLLGFIAAMQREIKFAAMRFQVWTLTVRPDRTANLLCEDGDGKPVYTHHLEHTDFPLPEITLWIENNTIHRPTEH